LGRQQSGGNRGAPRRAVAELTVADQTAENEKELRAMRPDEILSVNEIKKLLDHTAPGGRRPLPDSSGKKWTRNRTINPGANPPHS
jgi:hypothetical protein